MKKSSQGMEQRTGGRGTGDDKLYGGLGTNYLDGGDGNIEIGTVDNPAIQQMQFAVLFGRARFEAANDTEGRMAA